LHPAWAVLPPDTDEQLPPPPEGPPEGPPEDLVTAMRRNRVGAVFLFTGQYRMSLSDWSIDALLEPLADTRVPVFINPNPGGGDWQQDRTDWSAVVDLCRRWPRLPVVVSEFRIRESQRTVYRALDACENLRIETSGYWLHHGIEYITRRWQSERLIFGSNWPMFGQHMTLATLTCAQIDEADKRKIAGDNLRELIGWCEPEHLSYEPAVPLEEYVAFGRSGTSGGPAAEMVFHDCHGHLGGRMAHYHVPDGDVDSLVHEMDRLGVKQCCVFSFCGVLSDEQFGNDMIAQAVQRYPDRFVGFTMLNPHRGRDEMRRELERCAAMGLRGIKLINSYQGYPSDGPNIEAACEWAHEHKQFILNHYWGNPRNLENLVTKFPGACFITGHATSEYAELMKKCENLYVCSCPLVGPRACEDMVAAIGADRLMFGSDLSDLPIAWGLGPILFARLSEADKRLILGGNLVRLLETHSR